ncbi:MAG: sugar phosphate isomerase/epimerase family protein [Candidatus Methylacidiphilales bacterium]|nr:TIM barrel protein [Candidatus Methylacidiphilales bacterium]
MASPQLLLPGLVSITFRQLTPREVVELVVKAGTPAVEWGGDVHVPHGDLVRAREVKVLCDTEGVDIPAYGSYFRLGQSEKLGLPFSQVLDSAELLGAPVIRVWAGVKGSADTTLDERAEIVEDAMRIADMAQARGIKVSYEYHGGTLTDTAESAAELLAQTGHPAIQTLWQPAVGLPVEQAEHELAAVLPRLSHVHVFHWFPRAERQPLADGRDRWIRYLTMASRHKEIVPCLIEFVQNAEPKQFLADAEVLKEMIAEVAKGLLE